jgi:hypothetical protein
MHCRKERKKIGHKKIERQNVEKREMAKTKVN